MKIKRNIMVFLSFLILFGMIGSGCSRQEESLDTSNPSVSGQESKEDITPEDAAPSEVPEEKSGEVSEDIPANEAASPWKLVSETSVDTAVNYAGFLNEEVGVTVGYAGATSYTEDGGKHWSQSNNVSACRYGLDFYDDTFIVNSGNSGVNLVSRDKGRTWKKLGDFPLKIGNAYNKFLSVLDTNTIYIGSSKTLGVSKDGGLTWKELALPEDCRKPAAMFFMNPETGYVFNGDGTLYKTKDSGETWTSQTIDLSGNSIINSPMPGAAVHFQDEEHGMILYTTKSYQLICIRTADGGSTWETVEMPKLTGSAPYISRDGRYLTVSSAMKKIGLYKLEE